VNAQLVGHGNQAPAVLGHEHAGHGGHAVPLLAGERPRNLRQAGGDPSTLEVGEHGSSPLPRKPRRRFVGKCSCGHHLPTCAQETRYCTPLYTTLSFPDLFMVVFLGIVGKSLFCMGFCWRVSRRFLGFLGKTLHA
jgi:hypothetical protein